MKRGEFYLVQKPGSQRKGRRGRPISVRDLAAPPVLRLVSEEDPRKQRVFVIASRQALIDSKFSSLICAPVYSQHDGLSTQLRVGIEEGLKKDSSIHCDALVSLPKSLLTRYVGSLAASKLKEFDNALAIALGFDGGAGFSLQREL